MTSEDDGIADAVARVVATGEQRRAQRAMTAFRNLRRYERRIAKEAAVMGYVLGRRAGQIAGRNGESILDEPRDFPSDFAILQQVIEHCDSTSDLYPFLAAACDGKRRRITKAQLFDFERAEDRP